MPNRTYTSSMPVSAEALFAWHERPGAFERLVPPWAPVTLASFEGIRDGQRAVLLLGKPPARIRWVAEHADYVAGRQFRDIQRSGPFHRWDHTHHMEPIDDNSSRLVDALRYELPLGRLGDRIGGGLIRRQLDSQFTYRHATTRTDLRVHQAINPTGRSLRIAITGASGMVGRLLTAFLTTGGHQVLRLVRGRSAAPDAVFWDPDTGEIDAGKLEGLDAVVHLAGESIVALRWTAAKRARIEQSRIRGTHLLADTLARLKAPPTAFLSASGIAIYGDRGDEALDERTPTADATFLARVCASWEGATAPATAAGIRTVLLRIGVVLTPRGGALAQLVRPFALGAGVQVGRSADFMSWIAPDDLVYAIGHLVMNSALSGAVNLVGPRPVAQRDFTTTLGRVLRRPVAGRIPPALTLSVLGQMADETLFKSLRLAPARLIDDGFIFQYPDLESALRHQLGRFVPQQIPLSPASPS
ncbi:MAG: TIGR01777 family oxidoreductase [Rhodothermales bacterium]|nr:TIGR01777 family oxidoreductase [Rhodothermales bacterium]